MDKSNSNFNVYTRYLKIRCHQYWCIKKNEDSPVATKSTKQKTTNLSFKIKTKLIPYKNRKKKLNNKITYILFNIV